ncbi:CCR4-NOT transcription complex [Eremomyces bilateralis CBS 781.70]|uniref:General negative regulator of transcription subunit n=1 Tax=Eremomyces bilateralis CBS 781.70 TaxID=1392243 RepID=A0A6G1FVA7_9PEZI|nr:CCR4-NOT transcription complex [Eremomyces bilateralis CBS 781.70]KAF1809724.1 CCR4-NOT transcription complex [Eremomyces bilateralis CBS 781.70]
MAARKLANEVERCFKKVKEGVEAFESIHDKIQTCTNPSQKEKLEDALKKEIKKLQRSRDQIKAWAAMNDIKDKKPLMEHRKLIESQMEKFKQVEKEMKTKAYSKEGLSAASKLDPKEKEKLECCEFLGTMLEELERQIEMQEADVEHLQATMKKGKKDTSKADRIAELEDMVERHKWHQGKLELLLRALENGGVEVEQVRDVEESIRYYVESNQDPDFVEDDSFYEDFNLQEEEGLYGMANEGDRVSSQDNQSMPGDIDLESKPLKPKPTSMSDASGTVVRRPSTQMKSPLPSLATLHQPPLPASSGPTTSMKPAPIPTPGGPLKYASAAAAAAASDKHNVGISPLPAPPGTQASDASSLTPVSGSKPSSTSPSVVHAQAAAAAKQITGSTIDGTAPAPQHPAKSPALSHTIATRSMAVPRIPALEKEKTPQRPADIQTERKVSTTEAEEAHPGTPALTNGDTHSEPEEPDPIFHLPKNLQELLDMADSKPGAPESTIPDDQLLDASMFTHPGTLDSDARRYKPQNPYPHTPATYPHLPDPIFDDPRLYKRIDTDALFYAFYYRQNTLQQHLAAESLKYQSWRFHTQYQTWFQRHDEPKQISQDYEQGTYRFFDYESTWMNRRKADFVFQYKFLEDDV